MTGAEVDQEIERELEKSANLRRAITRQNRMLAIILVLAIIGPVIAGWWVNQRYPSISTVSIGNMRSVGNTELCPGDTIYYQYDLHAQGAGRLIRDRTIWRIDPPRTVVFSQGRTFILPRAIDQDLVEAWHIPPTYLNPATDEMDVLAPGTYLMLTSITSPATPIIAIGEVPFTIREDCP